MINYLFPDPPAVPKVGFEEIKLAIQTPTQFVVINTLPVHEQGVLIPTTLALDKEEATMNAFISNYDTASRHIIVYGKHAADDSAEKKYRQLKRLGFVNVFVYGGGLFEWILLQDIYGEAHFPTTAPPPKDLLYYAPKRSSEWFSRNELALLRS